MFGYRDFGHRKLIIFIGESLQIINRGKSYDYYYTFYIANRDFFQILSSSHMIYSIAVEFSSNLIYRIMILLFLLLRLLKALSMKIKRRNKKKITQEQSAAK